MRRCSVTTRRHLRRLTRLLWRRILARGLLDLVVPPLELLGERLKTRCLEPVVVLLALRLPLPVPALLVLPRLSFLVDLRLALLLLMPHDLEMRPVHVDLEPLGLRISMHRGRHAHLDLLERHLGTAHHQGILPIELQLQ